MIKIHILFVKSKIKQQLIPFCYINKNKLTKSLNKNNPILKPICNHPIPPPPFYM